MKTNIKHSYFTFRSFLIIKASRVNLVTERAINITITQTIAPFAFLEQVKQKIRFQRGIKLYTLGIA
jgi:hypothetical protein